MIKYNCSNCNIDLETSECPVCGKRAELKESAIFWCENCNIPLFRGECKLCDDAKRPQKIRRLVSDLRPVFPEERLLMEILLDEPMKYKDASVWNASGNIYYADGKRINLTIGKRIKEIDPQHVIEQIVTYAPQNTYDAFNVYIKRFIEANSERYNYITTEATQYVRKMASGFDTTSMFVSFSGGKDSTVVSDLVTKGLGTQQILHIYGDTTLEFPKTKEYVERFKKAHPKTPVLISKNKDKDFNELCEQLGPPSRVMRWCCTIFKTGAIQRKIQSLFRGKKQVLTFYGIRRNESASRSKYDRESEGAKITIQKTVSPIIDWFDFDIWLYLLTTGIDFNDAYRLGYTRVGCWCCPNNSMWSEFMSKIYMPEEYRRWHDLLIRFAIKIGKPDPEVYVNEGNWKARQGGNGLEYANTSVITFEPCVLQEDTINFELKRPITEELYELFKPFGYINRTLGNERLGEVYIVGRDGSMKLRLQGRVGSSTLKVSILDKNAGHAASKKVVEQFIKCQITKYQMCLGCLACEAVCKHGAISIETDHGGLKSYRISDDKCVRCGKCISHFDGGCYMRKVMCIKR